MFMFDQPVAETPASTMERQIAETPWTLVSTRWRYCRVTLTCLKDGVLVRWTRWGRLWHRLMLGHWPDGITEVP